MSERSMAGPLGSAIGDPGAPTTYVRDVDGGPLGGTVGDTGAPTTYVRDIRYVVAFSIIVFLQEVLCIFSPSCTYIHLGPWTSDEYKCYSYHGIRATI
jgi:hypothetical protein